MEVPGRRCLGRGHGRRRQPELSGLHFGAYLGTAQGHPLLSPLQGLARDLAQSLGDVLMIDNYDRGDLGNSELE